MTAKTETVGAELQALADTNGMIHPRRAVEWARRHTRSALYAELEWDDSAAAEEWRLTQVRRLIAIHIVDAQGKREYISLSIDRPQGGGYRRLTQILPRVDLREAMLHDALADLERMRLKYEWLSELARVWEAAHVVEEEAATRKRRGGGRKRAA